MFEDKESKEMMKILSENKRKIRGNKTRTIVTKEKAKDVLRSVWMCVGFVVVISLISYYLV